MKILVDTSVWSLALRKKTLTVDEKKHTEELSELIRELRVVIVGPIRQELLSCISDKQKFLLLKTKLQAFEDLPLTQNDFEKAAEFFNECRRNGIQGSHIDFLICAVAYNNQLRLFTTDKDFSEYVKLLKIELHNAREENTEEENKKDNT